MDMHEQAPDSARVAMTLSAGAPPESVQKFCRAWNERAHRAGNDARISVIRVIRSSGHVNYHLRMSMPGRPPVVLSMKSIDDGALDAASSALLERNRKAGGG